MWPHHAKGLFILRVLKNISRVSAAHSWSVSQHSKINFISPSDHVIFFLHKIFTLHNNVYGDFPKISDHFSKISKDLQQFARGTFPNISRRFPDIFRRLPKIGEDDQRRSEAVSIIHQQILVELKCQKIIFQKNDIFTRDIISSHVRISYRFY